MNLRELYKLTLARVKESNGSKAIKTIITNALNYAYVNELSKESTLYTQGYVPIINGAGILPDDAHDIISTSPKLEEGEMIRGNAIISDRDVTFQIIYSTVPVPLINDSDIPKLPKKYHYTLSTYACFAYFQAMNNPEMAKMYFDMYSKEKEELRGLANTEEVTKDIYGGD